MGPVSAACEARALRMLEDVCGKALARFPASLEEDDLVLQDKSLSYNARNCVVMRRGEKRVLRYFIDYARKLAPVLEANPERFPELRPSLIGA
jgi:Rubisco LSMT substrate-binding